MEEVVENTPESKEVGRKRRKREGLADNEIILVNKSTLKEKYVCVTANHSGGKCVTHTHCMKHATDTNRFLILTEDMLATWAEALMTKKTKR